MVENTDYQENLVAEPSETFIMVSTLQNSSSNAIIGTNIKTNEEVAIKLVSLNFSHKPFVTPFFLGTRENQASPVALRD